MDPDGNLSATAYPQKPVPLIDQVVSSIKVGNGQGGWLETRFRYAGARSDQSGRGFLGYGRMESLDVASGVTTTTWFSQTWPTIGVTTAMRQTAGSGVVLADSCTELDSQTIAHSNGRSTRFPFTKTQTVTKNDLSGDPGHIHHGMGLRRWLGQSHAGWSAAVITAGSLRELLQEPASPNFHKIKLHAG